MKSLSLETFPEANNKIGKVAVLAPQACIGCGVCAHKCPTQSLELVHRKGEQDVPEAGEIDLLIYIEGQRLAVSKATDGIAHERELISGFPVFFYLDLTS